MKLTSVGQRYGGAPWLFENVTVELEPGQVIAFSGSNGTGKSTVLALLAGLLRPTAGTITGRPRRIGFVPERFPSRQRMSAAAYLVHMGRVRGLSTAEARRTTRSLLERFSFAGGPGSAMRTLSKGNAQKVALAQALLVPPDLLILDEPWAGLDEVGHDVLTGIIAESAARGAIVALSRQLAVPGPVLETLRYDLADRRLHQPQVAAGSTAERITPLMRILLHSHDTSRPLPAPWTGTPVARECVRVLVPQQDTDSLLLTALRAGWSVVEVTPVGGAP